MKVTPQSVDPTNGGIPFLTVQQTIAAKQIHRESTKSLQNSSPHVVQNPENALKTPQIPIIQGGAPMIVKLVYNSNNYGLWYL